MLKHGTVHDYTCSLQAVDGQLTCKAVIIIRAQTVVGVSKALVIATSFLYKHPSLTSLEYYYYIKYILVTLKPVCSVSLRILRVFSTSSLL